MSIKIGDFVKGITNDYSITNTKMTRGVVADVRDEGIVVRVLNHNDDETGMYIVDPEKFEVIGHQKQFDRAEVLKLLKDGCKKAILDYDLRGADLSGTDLSDIDLSGTDLSETDLSGTNLNNTNLNSTNLRRATLSDATLNNTNLRGADLSDAELSDADLRGADLDYSCYPLWCGSLHLKADKRLACQLAYHLCSLQCDDADYIKMRNSILDFANQFHRVRECGELRERKI
jgi:hypothetical protein